MATKITRKNPFEDITDPNVTNNTYEQTSNQEGFGQPQMSEATPAQNEWGQPTQEYNGRMTNPFGRAETYADNTQYQDDIDMAREDEYNQASYGNQAWNPDAVKPQQFGQYNQGEGNYQTKSGFGIEEGSGAPSDHLNEPPLLEGMYKKPFKILNFS